MCEILNVHVQKVDKGMGSIPVSRLKKERYQIGIVLFFEPCQGSKVRCLRSAPVRAGRGPPDLVRRLALVCTENFRSKRKYVFDSVRIGALFCMHMTAGPDFTGLCLIGGAAEEEAFQCGTVKGKEGPEVTEACKGWCGNHGE